MVSRRPSHPPPDRLARLLQEAGGEAVRAADDELPGGASWQEDGWADQDDGRDPPEPVGAALPSGRHRKAGGVPLLSVPAALRSAQLAVGSRAVRGLLVLTVVAALVLGGRWLWAQRPAEASGVQRVVGLGGEEEPGVDGRDDGAGADEGGGVEQGDEPEDADEAAGVGGDGAGEDTSRDADGGDGDQDGVATELVVHVTGQVEEPGVVELPAGSRVVDAVRAAGGLTGEADQSTVNLARPLVDGEQLWVGRPGEEPPAGWSPPTAGGGTSSGRGGAAATADPVPLDLNTATQADLEELPGIGPVTAGHILTWRDEHGGFSRVDELLEVSGIGERTLAQLEPLVTVDG